MACIAKNVCIKDRVITTFDKYNARPCDINRKAILVFVLLMCNARICTIFLKYLINKQTGK